MRRKREEPKLDTAPAPAAAARIKGARAQRPLSGLRRRGPVVAARPSPARPRAHIRPRARKLITLSPATRKWSWTIRPKALAASQTFCVISMSARDGEDDADG